MSKIKVKRGTKEQKIEIVKGMYITVSDNNAVRVDIESPIDAIIAIWKGAKRDMSLQMVEYGKKELLKLLEGVEEDNNNRAKRILVTGLRNTYKYFIDKSETDYKECMEFIREFRSNREENYAISKDYCEFLKKQIERVERSIK